VFNLESRNIRVKVTFTVNLPVYLENFAISTSALGHTSCQSIESHNPTIQENSIHWLNILSKHFASKLELWDPDFGLRTHNN